MDNAAVVRQLIERTARDFSSYFEGTRWAAAAERIISSAVTGSGSLSEHRELVESMLPDTEDDGRWEASYALNTGAMVLSLIDFLETQDEDHYRDAVTLFFDTVDFKVHQELESRGITAPSEEQIATHPIFIEERAWFASVQSDCRRPSEQSASPLHRSRLVQSSAGRELAVRHIEVHRRRMLLPGCCRETPTSVAPRVSALPEEA